MRRLLTLGIAAGLAALVALPGAAQAVGSPSPSASASRSVTPTATPTATGSPTQTPSATPSKTPPPKKPKPKPHKSTHHAGTTVSGPHMYIPGTGNSHYAAASTVAVSQTTNLTNQMVVVSWTGFTPSTNVPYDPASTDYPVMVAQCRGSDPKTPDQCFDATNGGSPAQFGANGPGNTAYATTNPDGTGQTEILLYTSVQNQFLGCDATHACSLVVVPSQGGDSIDYQPPHCANHTVDNQVTDLGQYAFGPMTSAPGTANGYCSWQQRIVIPLHFAPTPNGCPQRAADFTAGGSPMLARAMLQWETGMCFGASPVTLQYNSEINESEARGDFASGLFDVGFTTQPLTGPANHPYTYAPVAVSAASIAYWVDNQATYQAYTNMKLNARLVTKLLTTSYNFSNESCPGAAHYQFGCDNSVDNNPQSLYTDPEFVKLNPTITNAANPTGYQIPTVVSGNSDTTWVTTSWIAADKAASNFLAGQFDPWGMHVNTYYLGLKYPTDAFLPMDPYIPLSTQYSPTYPLASVGTYQAENWMPGTLDTKDPSTGNYTALSPETPGDRDLFAFTDQSDAATFLFPTVALENAAGKFVQPTTNSMAAAVKDMTVNPDGITRSMNYTKRDPAAYPLTMVIYAVVPTGGISAAKAAKIAQFLDYVANQGQQAGTAPGDLAPGYLPLPSALRQQTLAAAYKVLHQTGNPKPASSPSKSPSPSSSSSPSSSPSKSSPSKSSPSPSASAPGAATAHSIAVSFSRPDATGMPWVVLALLLAGLVLIVAGPAALVAGSPGARAAIGSGARRIRRLSSGIGNFPGRGTSSGTRPGGRRNKRGASRSPWRRIS
jgi:hypothetical protein